MSRTRLIFVLSVVAAEASWFSLLAYLGVRLLDWAAAGIGRVATSYSDSGPAPTAIPWPTNEPTASATASQPRSAAAMRDVQCMLW